MAGDPSRVAASGGASELTKGDRKRIARLVHSAENKTGLQLVVYVGPVDGDPAEHAQELVAQADVPAVLLLVAPGHRRLEVRTTASVRDRVPDEAAARVVEVMTPLLQAGDVVGAVRAGLATLVTAAGRARRGRGEELPDVLGA